MGEGPAPAWPRGDLPGSGSAVQSAVGNIAPPRLLIRTNGLPMPAGRVCTNVLFVLLVSVSGPMGFKACQVV